MSNNAITGYINKPSGKLVGTLTGVQGITGCIVQNGQMTGLLATATIANANPYEGDYEVTPTVEGLVMETRQKYMTDDVTIRAIPFYEVGNNTGGNTVYIASEIELE